MDKPHERIAAQPLLRTLAASFDGVRSFARAVTDDADAVAWFVRVAHAGGCPRCRSTSWRADGDHHVDCARCGPVSVYCKTALARRRLPARLLLSALFRVFVDTDSPTSRGFARSEGERLGTCWALLHQVRAALLALAPGGDRQVIVQVLGREQERNRAFVAVCVSSDGRPVVSVAPQPDEDLESQRLSPSPEPSQKLAAPLAALAVGLLRAWLTAHFRGVSARWLPLYLREFNARHGRARARDADLRSETVRRHPRR